jgi:hypothetical protein
VEACGLVCRPAAACVTAHGGARLPEPVGRPPKARWRPRMQPKRELERKKKKEKESKIAFFRFLLLFGIWTFQRVMSEKSEKNFPPPSLASQVAREAPRAHDSSGLLSVLGPRPGEPHPLCSSEICVARLPNFGKELLLHSFGRAGFPFAEGRFSRRIDIRCP